MGLQIHNLRTWVEETMAGPDPEWLISDMIPHAGLTVIAGRAKYGKKSWLAFLASIAMASGQEIGPFRPTRRSKGLILCREGAPKFTAKRFPALAKGHNFDLNSIGDNLLIMHGGQFYMDDPACVAELLEIVAAEKLEFVVIDTFARSFQGEENSSRDMMKALRVTETLRDMGCATILVHHLNKGSKYAPEGEPDADFGMRGSNALSGAYDSILSVQQLYVEDDGPSGFSQGSFLIYGGKNIEFQCGEIEWGPAFGGGYRVKFNKCDMPTVVVPKGKKS